MFLTCIKKTHETYAHVPFSPLWLNQWHDEQTRLILRIVVMNCFCPAALPGLPT